jgi:glycosyltransferase involved in cell wall biosynthesis
MSVLHNSVRPMTPVSAEAVQSLRQRLQIPDGVQVILAAGRLSFEKGYVDLIEALALLARKVAAAEWKLLLAGTGPEQARLLEAIRRHRLEPSVALLGHQASLREFYALANIVALPSHSEGSPNVLLEAMASGVPIAATAVGGIPEIATHQETALLVPPRDPAAMAEALERLLLDKQLAQRLGAQAQTAAASFYPECYLRALLTLYVDLLKTAP